MNKQIALSVLLLVFLYGCTSQEPVSSAERVVESSDAGSAVGELKTVTDKIWVTDAGVKFIVNPDKIRSGGPPKGGIGVDRGIPALDIDNLNFVSVADASAFIGDTELVLVVINNGEKKVYPLQIMVWHEIANDIIGGDPIAVTYCPLCGSGIAYDRRIVVDGEITVARFGTSGKLYNSNLVMYDDVTDTYWQQIDGKAIVGDLVGTELTEVSVDTVVWRDFKSLHADALVLNQDTGMSRAYGRDPYGSYYEDSFLFFSVEEEDDRIHAKTVVFGIEVKGTYKAYQEKDLIAESVISDTVGGVGVTLTRDAAGIITIVDDVGNEIVKERDFWFAWYAFHPSTGLYGVAE
jgi:hypothetical protein